MVTAIHYRNIVVEESGHFDYGIEEQLEKETSSEQIAVDIETTKVNLHKAPMELDVYGNQNKSEEKDYSPKRRETTHLIVQELLKLLTPHRKENDIVNSALMEIDPSKVSDKSNMEINPMQEDEIIDIPNETRACQIRKNLSFYSRLMVKSFKANSKSKATFVEMEFKNEKLTGSNAITIINKRSFSSLGDNRDINSQKVISGRFRRESLKEQDRKAPKVRFKAIKISKENPYINNSSVNNMFKEKESNGSTVVLLTGALVVYGLTDELVGSSSRVPGMDMNRKGLLQKELTLKIDDEAFDIFAVMETNLNEKEGFFVEKKLENFRFFWLDTSKDKKKGL
ncbi:35042_t:CDS:2, partial [Gigaspora margarita]